MSYLQAIAGYGNLAAELPSMPESGYACPVCGEHRPELFSHHRPTWAPDIRGFCAGSDRVVPVAQVRDEREKIRAEWRRRERRWMLAESGQVPEGSSAYGLWQFASGRD